MEAHRLRLAARLSSMIGTLGQDRQILVPISALLNNGALCLGLGSILSQVKINDE